MLSASNDITSAIVNLIIKWTVLDNFRKICFFSIIDHKAHKNYSDRNFYNSSTQLRAFQVVNDSATFPYKYHFEYHTSLFVVVQVEPMSKLIEFSKITPSLLAQKSVTNLQTHTHVLYNSASKIQRKQKQ